MKAKKRPLLDQRPIVQYTRAFAAWVERTIKKMEGVEEERMRIAIREALTAKGPHGRDGSALDHALHCMRLVQMNVEGPMGLEREPESALVYLSFALESLEATTGALQEELGAAEAEMGLRKIRRAGRAA